MSEQLDPHWQSEERPVRVTVRAQTAAPRASVQPSAQPDMVSVSRRPAAIAGILLSGGVLLSLYGASDLFLGQALPVAKSDATITITTKGFEPASVSVKPGQTVTWENKGDIPHILTSDTLLTADGSLDTSPIFTGSTLTVTISKSATAGTYTYESLTSSFSGSIVVTAGDITKTAESSSSVSSVAVEPVPTPVSSVSSSSSSSSSSVTSLGAWTAPSSRSTAGNPFPAQVGAPQVPVIPTTPTGLVPRNPFALNHTSYQPPVQAVTTGQQSSVKAASSSLHGGAPISEHKPTKQPQTGSGEWLVALMGCIALTLVTKKALSEQAWTERR